MKNKFIIPILMAITCNVYSAPIARVILTPTPHVESININNLPSISDVVSFGQYAWAYDVASGIASFFNGKTWSDGNQIAGMTMVRIFPAYPLTGKTQETWSLGEIDNKEFVSYFNGQNWSTPLSVASIFNNIKYDTVRMAASDGYAYLVLSEIDSTNPVTYFSINNPNTHQWSAPQSVEGSFISQQLDSMSDETPELFFVVKPGFGTPSYGYKLYKVNGETDQVSLIKLTDDDTPYTGAVMLSDNNSYFLSTLPEYSSTPSYTYFGNNLGSMSVSNFYGSNKLFDSEYRNLVCQIGYDTKNMVSIFGCINFNMPNPQWSVSPLPSSFMMISKIQATTNGAWVGAGLYSNGFDNINPHIYHYDLAKQSLSDTNYPVFTNVNTSMHAISDGTVMACSVSAQSWEKSSTPVLNYYHVKSNQNSWDKIDTTSSQTLGCQFSYSGNFWHKISTLNLAVNENLWVY